MQRLIGGDPRAEGTDGAKTLLRRYTPTMWYERNRVNRSLPFHWTIRPSWGPEVVSLLLSSGLIVIMSGLLGDFPKGYVQGHSKGKERSSNVDSGVWEFAEDLYCDEGSETRVDVGGTMLPSCGSEVLGSWSGHVHLSNECLVWSGG